MSDGLTVDLTGLRELATRLSREGTALDVCVALPPLALPGDDGGLTSAVSAFAQAETVASHHTSQRLRQLARRLESRANAVQQADQLGVR